MLNWLQQIPEDLLRAHAKLYLDYVWALEGAARYSEADDCLNYLDTVARNDPYIQGRVAILRTFIASDRGDFQGTERHARRALEILSKDDVGVSLVSGPLAGMYMSQGRFAEAEPLIRSNYEAIRRAGSVNNAVMPLTYVGFITFLRGQLHEAVEVYQEAIELAARNPNTATTCLAHLLLGSVHYEWNNLGEAACQQQLAVDTYRSSKIFGSMDLDTAYLHLARTRAAMGDYREASRALDSADRILSRGEASPLRMARDAAFHAVTASLMGETAGANGWVDNLLKIEGVAHTDAFITALQLVVARKGKADADRMLKGMYEFSAAQGLRTYMAWIRGLQALNSTDTDATLVWLDEALAIGRPEGFIRTFADAGASLTPMLRQAMSQGDEREYAGRLLAIIQTEDRRRREHQDGRVPIAQSSESLSEREMEVLRLVAAGLSNRQITERLHISLNTVKRHIYNVSQRLQVGSRTQAVAKARELKLL